MALRLLKLCFWIGIGVLFLFPINASDFYHHLNTGRDIWNTHELPYSDTYSFTAFGKPWVAHSWGTGLVYYLLYASVGSVGISAFTALVGIGTVWFLLKMAKRLHVSALLAYPVVSLIAALLSLRWPTRPEIFSPFFLSIVLLGLSNRTRISVWYIALFFLWGILYGSSAFLGIGILGLFVIFVSTQKIRDSVITLLSAVAACLNGYGLSSFLYILQIPAIAAHTGEWLPILETINPVRPDLVLFYQWQVVSYIIFTAVSIGAFILAVFKKQKSGMVWMAMLLAIAVAAPYNSVRFINLAPVLAPPLLFFAIGTLPKKMARLIAIGIGVIALCVSIVRFATFSVGTGEEFTKKPMQFLRTHGIQGHIMSIQEMGAHISWELPESKILYDTRDDLYQPTGIFSEVQKLDEGKLSIEPFVAKYGISVIIADMTTGAVYKPLLYSDQWALVYTTDGFYILIQRQIASEKKLATYDAIDPLRSPPAKPGMMEEAYQQHNALEKVDPASIENAVRTAEVAIALNKTDDTKRIQEILPLPGRLRVRNSIETVATAELLGKYALASGDCPRAKDMLMLAEKNSYGKLLFSPHIRLPNSTDRYLGQYYQRCENNTVKAKEHYQKFLKSTNNPLEKRAIEQLMSTL